jgi:hypothetical protein
MIEALCFVGGAFAGAAAVLAFISSAKPRLPW